MKQKTTHKNRQCACTKGEKCSCKECNCAKAEKNTDAHVSQTCTCTKRESAFPICFLACVLTAVLVSMTFTVGFSAVFNYSLKHKYGSRFSGQFSASLNDARDGEMLEIGAGAVIDFYESGQTGFIYASTDDCTACASFEERLTSIASSIDTLSSVYHYNYPSDNDPDEYDNYAMAITLDGDTTPTLLYVRDGKIYDRLDDYLSEAGLSSFLAKYK